MALNLSFRVEDVAIRAYDDRQLAGILGFDHNESSVLLGDIHIFTPTCPGHEHLKRSYRGLGIGSKLLQEFLSYCKEKKITTITGNVTKDDLACSPFLLEWYQRHGFQIGPYTGDDFPDGTLSIVRELA